MIYMHMYPIYGSVTRFSLLHTRTHVHAKIVYFYQLFIFTRSLIARGTVMRGPLFWRTFCSVQILSSVCGVLWGW